MSCAGPIQTEIWGDLIRNAEPVAKKGSIFSEYVQQAHRLSETETSKPGWFWDASVVGERVWKVHSSLILRLWLLLRQMMRASQLLSVQQM